MAVKVTHSSLLLFIFQVPVTKLWKQTNCYIHTHQNITVIISEGWDGNGGRINYGFHLLFY